MRIYVNEKQAGSRKNVLAHEPYEIDFEKGTLSELIAVFTVNEVARYNTQQENKLHNAPLLGEDARFEERPMNKQTVDPSDAIRTALEGFEDGLVRVLQNEEELTDLDREVIVREGDVFTFIKLTFLAGRMW